MESRKDNPKHPYESCQKKKKEKAETFGAPSEQLQAEESDWQGNVLGNIV